jgi:hypothetical protein
MKLAIKLLLNISSTLSFMDLIILFCTVLKHAQTMQVLSHGLNYSTTGVTERRSSGYKDTYLF